MKKFKIFFGFFILLKTASFCFSAEPENFASQLRETLREASSVEQATAKIKADFILEKAELENRIKLMEAFNSKLSQDIGSLKNQIEKTEKIKSEKFSELKKYEVFEAGLKNILEKFNASAESDIYVCAKDFIFQNKKILERSKKLWVESKGELGVKKNRILHFGELFSVSENASPAFAKICDMVEGKIPYETLEIEIKGRGAK